MFTIGAARRRSGSCALFRAYVAAVLLELASGHVLAQPTQPSPVPPRATSPGSASGSGEAPPASVPADGRPAHTPTSQPPASRAPAPARDLTAAGATPGRDSSARAAVPADEPVEIVVTGSRIEEPIGRAVSLTEVIRRKDIERSGARNAAELLEERLGLQVVRSFNGSSLQLRGLDPEYTLILVDGDRLPGQINGAIDLTRYGSDTIERIEVVRGPGSALYGSDAIGGVINIITRESKRDFEANALASYGMHDTLDLAGLVAGRPIEPLRLQLTADLHRADAFRRPGRTNTALSQRETWSTGGRIAWEPDRRNTLVARGEYLHVGLDGVDSGAGGALFDRTQQQEQARATLEHRYKAASGVNLVSRASYSQFRDQYLLDQRGGTLLDQYEDNREHLGQLTHLLRFDAAEGHRTTVGVEQLFQDLDSARLSRTGHRYRFGAFAQHAWSVLDDADHELEIVPGVRLDADSQFGSQISPKLALRYRPRPNFEMRASYGRGFRAPTFQEQLLRFENPSAGYVVIGNPDLGAETSHGVDAGARLFNELFEANVTFFRNDLRNMIAYVSRGVDAGGETFTYDNLEHAWSMGVESTLMYHLRDDASAALSYTYMDTWDGENKRRLEGRAPHRLTANARISHPDWGLEFIARGSVSIGRRFYPADPNNPDEVRTSIPKPLTQLDLRLAKHFGTPLELFVGVDNLFGAGDVYTALAPLTLYGGARGRY